MNKRSSSRPGLTSCDEPLVKLNLLSMVEIFRDLNKEELQEIHDIVNMVTVRKGRIFYRPEEEAEVLFLLKRGKVLVYTITDEGKRLIIETIGPGMSFGEMPLTAQSMHRAFAEAAEDSQVCVLSRGDLERLLIRKPQVAIRIVQSLSQRLEDTQAKLQETTFRNATARLCRSLLRVARDTSELPGLTHQELADSTGLSRETVTNILSHLRAHGLVKLGKRKIAILDRAGLQELADT
ncbi:MAG: Crp/Fnr family transcriptional regulator [Chloroflexi bacterium]|nr:Crp/Fnr family transcriptional regulator [Chloroflexota bacterium]